MEDTTTTLIVSDEQRTRMIKEVSSRVVNIVSERMDIQNDHYDLDNDPEMDELIIELSEPHVTTAVMRGLSPFISNGEDIDVALMNEQDRLSEIIGTCLTDEFFKMMDEFIDDMEAADNILKSIT